MSVWINFQFATKTRSKDSAVSASFALWHLQTGLMVVLVAEHQLQLLCGRERTWRGFPANSATSFSGQPFAFAFARGFLFSKITSNELFHAPGPAANKLHQPSQTRNRQGAGTKLNVSV